MSKSLGFGENDKTLFEIRNTEDPKVKELHLQSGSWESQDAWFAIDEEDTKNITLKINQIIEKMIITNPKQWIWSHNRWK